MLEVVDRDVEGVARAGDRADLFGVEVAQRLGVAVEADPKQDRLLGGPGVEVLVVGLQQRHDVLVAGVPDLLGVPVAIDREDLPRSAGAGVDDAGLGVERQRPDVVGAERGERPRGALRLWDRQCRACPPGVVPATSVPSGRATSAVTQAASSVATRRACESPAGDVDGVDAPLIAGAEVGGLPVGRQR